MSVSPVAPFLLPIRAGALEPQALAKPISGMVPIWSRRFAPEPQAEALGSEEFLLPAKPRGSTAWSQQSFTFEFGNRVHDRLDHLRDALNALLQLRESCLWHRGLGCLTAEGNNRERSSEPSHQPGPGGKQGKPCSHRTQGSCVPAISIRTPSLGGLWFLVTSHEIPNTQRGKPPPSQLLQHSQTSAQRSCTGE